MGIEGLAAGEVRKKALQIRRSLSVDDRVEKSGIIERQLRDFILEKKDTKKLLCFYPMPDEPGFMPLYNWLLSMGYMLYFPMTGNCDMEFYRSNSMKEFKAGSFKVMEPVNREDKFITDSGTNEGCIAIVPGVAFDKKRNRIGFGKGYYDRFLPGVSHAIKVGVCFHECLFEEIPVHGLDVPMDIVITDKMRISYE